MPNPCNIIKFDSLTNSIEKPSFLLKNRNFDVIGKIKYSALKMSIHGNGLDNVSFDVYRFLDGEECSFWDQIEDLKIVDMAGYAQYEISIDKELSTEERKVITGISLEAELGQIILRNLHINDDDYFDYMADSNMDASGNIVPVTLYNPAAKQLQQSDGGFAMRHSLLDLVLMDKAPHWSIGVYPKEISVNVNGTVTKQPIESFQRTFTVDGTSIYDFLTGEVASEANLVFIFDTYNRKINVYDKYELGNDTGIIVSRRNLADEITISSGKDSIKNCFYVTGGDDVITNYLSAVNLTGNYIWQFGNSQLNDMPKGLADAIRSYITDRKSKFMLSSSRFLFMLLAKLRLFRPFRLPSMGTPKSFILFVIAVPPDTMFYYRVIESILIVPRSLFPSLICTSSFRTAIIFFTFPTDTFSVTSACR